MTLLYAHAFFIFICIFLVKTNVVRHFFVPLWAE